MPTELRSVPMPATTGTRLSALLYSEAAVVVDDIEVDVGPLGYAHPAKRIVWLEPPQPPADRGLAIQAIRQHTAAYLAELGLCREVGLEDFFVVG